MTQTRNRLASARKYLDVFQESWKADHEAAMECRTFEELLGEAVRIFDLVYVNILTRREVVYRGLMEPHPLLDEEEKRLFQDWLALVLADVPQLDSLEASFGSVENGNDLRDRIARAQGFLARWKPAQPAKAMGSRIVDFSHEDVEQIEALLASPPGSPGKPARAFRSVASADSSFLKYEQTIRASPECAARPR